MIPRPGKAEIVSAAATAAVGLFALWEASHYALGRPTRMGPGFFPVILGVALLALAVVVLFDKRPAEESPSQRPPLRAVAAIFGSVVAFGLVSQRFGIVPGTVALVLISAFAEPRIRPVTTLAIAAGLSAFAYFVFIQAFGIPMQAFRW